MSKKVRTHYDNLQVVETASPEVIRGAYRFLSQKWHPDKNPDNYEKASKNMQAIASAYEVLSDPERRKQHDRWIAEKRRRTITITADQKESEEREQEDREQETRRTKKYKNTEIGQVEKAKRALKRNVRNPYFWLLVAEPFFWAPVAALLSLMLLAMPLVNNAEGFFSNIWRWPSALLFVIATAIATFAFLTLIRRFCLAADLEDFASDEWEVPVVWGILALCYLSLFYFF